MTEVSFIDPEPTDEERQKAEEAGDDWPHLYRFRNARDLFVSQQAPSLELALRVLSEGADPDFDAAVYTIVAEYEDSIRPMATDEFLPPPDEAGPIAYQIRHRSDLVLSKLNDLHASFGDLADAVSGLAQRISELLSAGGSVG